MANKDKLVQIRVSEEECKLLAKKMEQANIKSVSAYVRKMMLDGYIITVDLSDVKEVLRLLHINSNNLNQYAKKANETGSIYKADIEKLRIQNSRLIEMMSELLDHFIEK